MTMITILQTASRDAYPALLAGLEAQFSGAGNVEIAARFLDAELADFHWQSRSAERWIGTYDSLDDDECELDRIAFCGKLGGIWFVAIGLVDGNGAVETLQHLQVASGEAEAMEAIRRLT